MKPKAEWKFCKLISFSGSMSRILLAVLYRKISFSPRIHMLNRKKFYFMCHRCVDIGKYSMVGTSNRTCIRSRWTGQKPHCYGLNQENDYASEYFLNVCQLCHYCNIFNIPVEKAPTILFRHQNGPIAQSNDGRLIVYPGTTLHMECLWMRRFGTPKWNVSHEFR